MYFKRTQNRNRDISFKKSISLKERIWSKVVVTSKAIHLLGEPRWREDALAGGYLLGSKAFDDVLGIFILFLGHFLLGFEVFLDILHIFAIEHEEGAFMVKKVLHHDDKEECEGDGDPWIPCNGEEEKKEDDDA
jgi:hypothetical protein